MTQHDPRPAPAGTCPVAALALGDALTASFAPFDPPLRPVPAPSDVSVRGSALHARAL